MSSSSGFDKSLLQGKVALITGGGSGIGLGITEELMRHGCNCIILSRTSAKLESAAMLLEQKISSTQPMSTRCLPATADVRNYDELAKAIEKSIEQAGGRLDILVNAAAGNFLALTETISPRAFKTVIEIDLLGTFHTTKICLPFLKRTKGCIINISACLQYNGTPMMGHASAAKAGIDSLTMTWANEFGPHGIRVNGIAPGPIDSTAGMDKLMPKGMKQDMTRKVPLGRLGTAQDIASATVFLASSKLAGYVNGHTMVVDGGSWMTYGAGPMYPDNVKAKI